MTGSSKDAARASLHIWCAHRYEAADASLQQFYDRLLAVLRQDVVRDGEWQLLECTSAWDGNWTSDCFVAFAWQNSAGERLLVTVNYAPNQSQCYVRLPFAELEGGEWRLSDQMADVVYDRNGDDLASRGLYVDATPWQASVARCHETQRSSATRWRRLLATDPVRRSGTRRSIAESA